MPPTAPTRVVRGQKMPSTMAGTKAAPARENEAATIKPGMKLDRNSVATETPVTHAYTIIVELGGNDMLRGSPPAETEKNLRALLARLKSAHVPVLLTGMHAQRNLGADYVKQFDGIYPRLARETGVLFYPFILDGVALNPKLNQADGMHPNPAGVKIVVARILPLVKKLVGR